MDPKSLVDPQSPEEDTIPQNELSFELFKDALERTLNPLNERIAFDEVFRLMNDEYGGMDLAIHSGSWSNDEIVQYFDRVQTGAQYEISTLSNKLSLTRAQMSGELMESSPGRGVPTNRTMTSNEMMNKFTSRDFHELNGMDLSSWIDLYHKVTNMRNAWTAEVFKEYDIKAQKAAAEIQLLQSQVARLEQELLQEKKRAATALAEAVVYTEQQCYLKVLEIDPRFTAAWHNLGQATPTGTTVITNDGVAYTKQQCYLKALEVDPHYTRAWNSLGTAVPTGTTTLTVNGVAYTKQQCFAKALEFDPRHAVAWINLGHAIPAGTTATVNGEEYTKQQCFSKYRVLST